MANFMIRFFIMQCIYQRYRWNSFDSQMGIQKQLVQPDAV